MFFPPCEANYKFERCLYTSRFNFLSQVFGLCFSLIGIDLVMFPFYLMFWGFKPFGCTHVNSSCPSFFLFSSLFYVLFNVSSPHTLSLILILLFCFVFVLFFFRFGASFGKGVLIFGCILSLVGDFVLLDFDY